MTPKQIRQLASRKLKQFGLTNWKIVNSKYCRIRTDPLTGEDEESFEIYFNLENGLGWCNLSHNQIVLNSKRLGRQTKQYACGVILHEIAHALVGYNPDVCNSLHHPIFNAICHNIGAFTDSEHALALGHKENP